MASTPQEMIQESLWEEFEQSMTPQEMLDQWNQEEQTEYCFNSMNEIDIENFEEFRRSLFEEYKEMRLE